MEKIKELRKFMKANFVELDNMDTDQEKKLPQPPLQKAYGDEEVIDLPEIDAEVIVKNDILKCFNDRKSWRKYKEEELTLKELSFLLWATQGVKKVTANNYATIRPVPSGGARHPFETYLVINRVQGLKQGVYRYLALEHKLVFLFNEYGIKEKVSEVNLGQTFVAEGAVVFMWSCMPYRGEWRYNISAHKTMLLDAGHLCQNLYLACEAIGCGTCAIGAYDQEAIDNFLKLDGEDEFIIYVAPVGKV